MDRLQKAVARAKEKKKLLSVESSDGQDFENLDYSQENVIQISEEQLASKRIVAGLSNLSESATFSFLRTKILSRMKSNGWQTLAVCSPTYDQGKTTVAANLAVAIAMEVTQSAILVDLDLRRPNLHRVFGLEPKIGLSDVLQETASMSDALISPGVNRLTLLPGGKALEHSSKWISDPLMQKIFTELRARYRSRFVIYDMPALLKSDDALKAIKSFDCSVLILEDGRNTGEEIRQAVQIAQQTNYLGYVLNKSGDKPPVSSKTAN